MIWFHGAQCESFWESAAGDGFYPRRLHLRREEPRALEKGSLIKRGPERGRDSIRVPITGARLFRAIAIGTPRIDTAHRLNSKGQEGWWKL